MEEKDPLPLKADEDKENAVPIIDLVRASVWDSEQKQEQKAKPKR